MEVDELRAEVVKFAFGYLQDGTIGEDWLASQLAPEQLPERFQRYEGLVDLHVAVHPKVAAFAQEVGPRLRTVKTETRRTEHVDRDEIEGRVDWSGTYQRRNDIAPRDTSLFVTHRRSEAYDIPENLVLKEFLAILAETVPHLATLDHEWVERTWLSEGGNDRIRDFLSVYRRNVHLNRITTPDDPLPTDRMIERAARARQPLYRDVARLLQWRNRLMEADGRAMEVLFDSAVVEPSAERLFELYVVFSFVEALEAHFEERSRIGPMVRGANRIATYGNPPCHLYHESSAPDLGLRFPTTPPESMPRIGSDDRTVQSDYRWAERSRDVGYWTETTRSALWGSDWSGRPDVLAVQPSLQEPSWPSGILVVEAKYSGRSKKIGEGVRELLRYLAYATVDAGEEGFLFPRDETEDAFGGHVHGLLVVNDVPGRDQFDLDGPIDIVQASNLLQRLQSVLDRALTNDDV